jgi:hypothetical protein
MNHNSFVLTNLYYHQVSLYGTFFPLVHQYTLALVGFFGLALVAIFLPKIHFWRIIFIRFLYAIFNTSL